MKKKNKKEKRSGFEATIAKQLKGSGAKYEPHYIRYVATKERRYLPDFVLPNGIIVEVKGRFTSSDRTKHLYIKEQHPELDIRFVFMRDNKINKNSDTTYSEWCLKNEFSYSVGEVPKYWALEKYNPL